MVKSPGTQLTWIVHFTYPQPRCNAFPYGWTRHILFIFILHSSLSTSSTFGFPDIFFFEVSLMISWLCMFAVCTRAYFMFGNALPHILYMESTCFMFTCFFMVFIFLHLVFEWWFEYFCFCFIRRPVISSNIWWPSHFSHWSPQMACCSDDTAVDSTMVECSAVECSEVWCIVVYCIAVQCTEVKRMHRRTMQCSVVQFSAVDFCAVQYTALLIISHKQVSINNPNICQTDFRNQEAYSMLVYISVRQLYKHLINEMSSTALFKQQSLNLSTIF